MSKVKTRDISSKSKSSSEEASIEEQHISSSTDSGEFDQENKEIHHSSKGRRLSVKKTSSTHYHHAITKPEDGAKSGEKKFRITKSADPDAPHHLAKDEHKKKSKPTASSIPKDEKLKKKNSTKEEISRTNEPVEIKLIDRISKIFKSYHKIKKRMSLLKKFRYWLLGSVEKNILEDFVFANKKGKGFDRIVIGISFALLAGSAIFAAIFVAEPLIIGIGITTAVIATIISAVSIYAGSKIRIELSAATNKFDQEENQKYSHILGVKRIVEKIEDDILKKSLYDLAKAQVMIFKKKETGILSNLDLSLEEYIGLYNQIKFEQQTNSNFAAQIQAKKHEVSHSVYNTMD